MLALLVSAPSSACPSGYTSYDSKTCFKVHCAAEKTLADARAQCAADGGSLAIIQDAVQNEAVRQLKEACGAPWVTIGLTSEGSSDDRCWHWSGYSSWTSYQNWDSGQPANNGGDEDCVAMGMHGQPGAGKWHDCSCDGLCMGTGALPFACRIDLATEASGSSACPGNCNAALEQGHCDVDSGSCTCYSGYKGVDCGCPESETCDTVTNNGVTSNCVKRAAVPGPDCWTHLDEAGWNAKYDPDQIEECTFSACNGEDGGDHDCCAASYAAGCALGNVYLSEAACYSWEDNGIDMCALRVCCSTANEPPPGFSHANQSTCPADLQILKAQREGKRQCWEASTPEGSSRAYATTVHAVLYSLLVWAACCCIGLGVEAWRVWRRPAVTPAPQADTPGSRQPLRRASTLEKIGSLARIQRHGNNSDGPAVKKRSSWMAMIHVVPVALVQFLDFSSDVVVASKMFGPDVHGFVRVARMIMLAFLASSIVGAWLALIAILPQQVPRTVRGACTVLVALVLAPINFHVLFVGCLYARLVSRIVDEDGAKQADMMYELFVLLKLAEASIESFVLGVMSLMIFGLGATDAPWLLISSSALSLLSLSYGIFAYLARKFEAALPSGTRMQLFFWVFLHILFMLDNVVYGVVTCVSSERQDGMLENLFFAFFIGGFMANMRILAGKDKRGWLRTVARCFVAYFFSSMFVVVDVTLLYPTSFPLERSWILSSTYYVKRLWWLVFGLAPIFFSDLERSIMHCVGVALLDLLVISPRIFVLTGRHKQSSPWVLYDPCGRLLQRLWPPKTKGRPIALVPSSLQASPFNAEAGHLSSTEDLRRRACDALEELQKQLTMNTDAQVADTATKYAVSDPPSDSPMDDAKLALRFQVDRLLSEEELPRLAGTQLRNVLAALRQYTPPPPTSGAHGKLGGEQDSDPCEGLLQLEQQLRSVLSARTEAVVPSATEVLAVLGATEASGEDGQAAQRAPRRRGVDAATSQQGGSGKPTKKPHPMRAVYLAEGLDAELWRPNRVTSGNNKYWTKSHDAETCDWFVSHNWGDSGTRKVALLRQHLNLQKMVAGVLVVLGVLGIYLIPFGFALNDLAPSVHPAWAPLSCVILTVLVLAWIKGSTLGLVSKKCTPWAVLPTTLWIDKCCVDQTRIAEFLETGLKTYLVKCNGMVAFVSKDYFSRLWCVYELATFCKYWSGPELSSRLVLLSLHWRFCATFFRPELTAEELEWLTSFSCRKARCFKPIDRADVLAAIREQWESEEQFDKFVREELPKVFRADKRKHGARFWIQIKQMFDIAFGG